MEPAAPASPSKLAWGPDEILRFYRAHHKYGVEFDKVSKMVGGGKAPELCESLWRRHQAYLSLDRKFQSEVAFVAMVQDSAAKALVADVGDGGSERAGGGGGSALAGSDELSAGEAEAEEVEDMATGRGRRRGRRRLRRGEEESEAEDEGEDEDGEQDEGSEEADAAAAVVAMASPGGGSGEHSTLAATRARRTPKRPAAHRSPDSAVKRARVAARGGTDDIYEYYDEGAQSITESARKRRPAASKRLDFETYQPAPTRRREAADEAKGIDALLALADAREEGEEEEEKEEQGEEEAETEVEDDEERDQLGIGDDEADEDYSLGGAGGGGGGRSRRTPHATPAKGRSRPASAHATPRRHAGRAGASPVGLRGMGSPAWLAGLGSDGDFMGDMPGMGDVPYLSSPGLPGHHLPPGFVPSPQNPMPRSRRRKHPPEGPPALISPLKSLFGRRQSLGGASSLLSVAALGFAGGEEQGSHPMTAAEARLRHCLSARVRRWALFEFFYSAIDRPFYMDNTLAELADHVGLPPDARLTRKEWSALRSALGRPRRLSLRFLREERARLERQRSAARSHYEGGGAATDPAVAATLPRALGVGQRVVARHPTTRQLHDGSVLTVAHDCYRVQFDRRELGVELVRDIDVMGAEPWENLPPALLARRPRLVMGGHLVIEGHGVSLQRLGGNGAGLGARADGAGGLRLPPRLIAPDPLIMAELAANLDKKEALLVQLRQMNDEAQAGMHSDPVTGVANPAFAQSYAQVVLKLKDINDNVQAKLLELERGPPAPAVPAGMPMDEAAVAAAAAALPPELQHAAQSGQGITAVALAGSALNEARRVVQTCRGKLSVAAAAAAKAAAAAAGAGPAEGAAVVSIDWSTPEGALLGGVVEGAVWSLVMLQQGADRAVPAHALAAALDRSLQSVKPKAASNQAMFSEIEEAMRALKLQLLAATG